MTTLQDIPKNYVYCFASDEACPQAGTCLHALAARVLTESGKNEPLLIQCINPNYAKQPADKCTFYRDSAPVRFARGMAHLFDELPLKQARAVRPRVMNCFSWRSIFFQARGGERLITPEEQEAIARVFRATGLGIEPKYDEYVSAIRW